MFINVNRAKAESKFEIRTGAAEREGKTPETIFASASLLETAVVFRFLTGAALADNEAKLALNLLNNIDKANGHECKYIKK